MQKATATAIAHNFGKYLDKVERGRSIQIVKHGRTIARIVPDCDFMVGTRAAELFRGHAGDVAAADAIAREIAKLNQEDGDALTH